MIDNKTICRTAQSTPRESAHFASNSHSDASTSGPAAEDVGWRPGAELSREPHSGPSARHTRRLSRRPSVPTLRPRSGLELLSPGTPDLRRCAAHHRLLQRQPQLHGT